MTQKTIRWVWLLCLWGLPSAHVALAKPRFGPFEQLKQQQRMHGYIYDFNHIIQAGRLPELPAAASPTLRQAIDRIYGCAASVCRAALHEDTTYVVRKAKDIQSPGTFALEIDPLIRQRLVDAAGSYQVTRVTQRRVPLDPRNRVGSFPGSEQVFRFIREEDARWSSPIGPIFIKLEKVWDPHGTFKQQQLYIIWSGPEKRQHYKLGYEWRAPGYVVIKAEYPLNEKSAEPEVQRIEGHTEDGRWVGQTEVEEHEYRAILPLQELD